MQQYNVFQAIYMSFYSKALYRDVAENWGGKTFLYLLLLVILSWIVLTIQLQLGLNRGFDKYSDRIATQVPVLTIKDGVLTTPENRPYIISNPDNNHQQIAIIDASGQYTTLEQAKTPVLVTKTAIIMQSGPNEIKTYEFSKNVNMVADPQVIKGYLNKFLGFFWIPFYFLFVIGAYIGRIIQALIYGIIGKLFSVISGRNISYGQAVQLSMVAITPAIVVITILDSFGISLSGLLYFLLAMVYLLFGVLANQKRT